MKTQTDLTEPNAPALDALDLRAEHVRPRVALERPERSIVVEREPRAPDGEHQVVPGPQRGWQEVEVPCAEGDAGLAEDVVRGRPWNID